MPNMGHCRFHNTVQDLLDCEEHMDDDAEDLSPAELKERDRLIQIARRIAQCETTKEQNS